eukprot:7385913-Prymnesium_polylepis.1
MLMQPIAYGRFRSDVSLATPPLTVAISYEAKRRYSSLLTLTNAQSPRHPHPRVQNIAARSFPGPGSFTPPPRNRSSAPRAHIAPR